MKYTVFRYLRIVAAILVITTLTAYFVDFDSKVPIETAQLAKIQLLPAILAGSLLVCAALIVLTLLLGRLYCSVICPLGILQDVIARVARFGKALLAPAKIKRQLKKSLEEKNDEETTELTSSEKRTKKQLDKSYRTLAKEARKRAKKPNYVYRKNPLPLRLLVLLLTLGSTTFGGFFFGLLEPYSIFGRIAVNVFKPIHSAINDVIYLVEQLFHGHNFYYVDLRPESLGALIVGVLSFVIICVFAGKFGRLYCNSICPIGTLLGFLSKYSFFRTQINADKCVNCGLCVKACKSSCIDIKEHKVDASRCVVCFDCFGACRKKALSFAPGKHATLAPNDLTSAASNASEALALDPETLQEKERIARSLAGFSRAKRDFITASLVVGAAALARASFSKAQEDEEDLVKTGSDADAFSAASEEYPTEEATVDENKPADYGQTPYKRQYVISPPGSISHKNFQNRCVGCHLCVSKCPAHVLKPMGFETGLKGFMQPRVDFAHGFCNYDCTICGSVCPAGAIKPMKKEDKQLVQTGHVVFIKENCIVYAKDESCGACSEHCPTQAIHMVPYKGTLTIPETTEDLCVGCGGCEYICPARPFRAVYIEGNPVHKQATPVVSEVNEDPEEFDFGF
ncbi:MAG: 4Fe-4S binding protein [Planctomycetia bacterium]|nr:4Fe-4S binding protein [Planctomycetia bacterium]